jgi:hypothetical protein
MRHGPAAAIIGAMTLGCLSFSAPAFAQGDIRAQIEQAQTHPSEPNQVPYALATGVALGEVYYQPGGVGYRRHAPENRPCSVEPSLCGP